MRALTAAEMREVDRLTTERQGVASLDLMEAAGQAVAKEVQAWGMLHRRGGLAVLCGKGNNGGDGFVAARLLKALRFEPFVCLFGRREEVRGDAAANLERWTAAGGEILEIGDEASLDAVWPRVAKAPLVLDAMLGTGLRRGATGLMAAAIRRLNEVSRNATTARPVLIFAVDTPSGLPSDGEAAEGPVVYAHRTVTFTAPKIGQLVAREAPCCGQLVVRGIGSPRALIEELGKGAVRLAEPSEFAGLPLVRAADANKGTYGHVLVLAGSVGKSGAAILAGCAGLRSGAGLVTVATPEPVQPLVAAGLAELMTAPLKATKSGALATGSLLDGTFAELEEGKTVLAIGPGLGMHKQTKEFVQTVVAQTELPIVLDADGLNAFADEGVRLRKRKTEFLCVTPHPGEMARLTGKTTKEVQSDRVAAAQDAAKAWNAYVVLKGFHTVLASPKGAVFVNTTGNAALAKGGTGDVLTGVLAALTAQFGTKDWLRVLALGVYLHGLAADIPSRALDMSGILASEIAEGIPAARKRLLSELWRG